MSISVALKNKTRKCVVSCKVGSVPRPTPQDPFLPPIFFSAVPPSLVNHAFQQEFEKTLLARRRDFCSF